MNLRTKLAVLFLTLAVVSVSTTTYIAYRLCQRFLTKHTSCALEDQARHTMSVIDHMLSDKYADMQVMAGDPVISSRDSTPRQITERLTQFKNAKNHFASLSLFDLNRVRIADTSGLHIGKQHHMVKYWEDVLQGKPSIAADIRESEDLLAPHVYFALHIRDSNGEPYRVLVARMPMSELQDTARYVTGVSHDISSVTIHLLDRDGRLLFSNRRGTDILTYDSTIWPQVKTWLSDAVSAVHVGDYLRTGEPSILAVARSRGGSDFEGNGWALLLHVPMADALSPALEVRDSLLFALLPLMFLSVLVSLFFSQTVSRRIIELRDLAAALSAGDTVKEAQAKSRDEIGQLAGVFNSMADKLRGSHAELKNWASTLERRVAERTGALLNSERELRDSHAALATSEAKYRTLVDNLPQRIFLKDADLRYVSCNKSYARDLGIRPDEITGKTDYGFFPKELADKYREDDKKIMKTGKMTDIEESYIVGNQETWVHTVKTPIKDEKDSCIGVLGIFWDITQQRLLQEELIQSEKLAAIGKLMSGVAHEINNPMTGITGLTEVLLKTNTGLDEPQLKQLNVIHAEALRVNRIVANLLSFARKHKTETMMVDIEETARRTLDVRAYQLRTEKIRVNTQFQGMIPRVRGDPCQLQQVFLNIISNAEHSMLEAHGEGNLNIRTYKHNGAVRIEFADDGLGIANSNLKLLFEPFFTTKEVGKGTGLGLAVSYGIVKEHGGKILVESEEGNGAKFTVELPVTQ